MRALWCGKSIDSTDVADEHGLGSILPGDRVCKTVVQLSLRLFKPDPYDDRFS
jgi:hypothetical protein